MSLDGSHGQLDKVDPEMSLMPASLQPKQSVGKQDTPAILSLMKDTPNLMSSSLILSSIHAQRKSQGNDICGAARSLERSDGGGRLLGEGGGLRGRRGSEQQAGVVDEVYVFRQSGSDLVNSKKLTAVSMGTNHTAFLTGENSALSSAISSQALPQIGRERR